MKSNNVNRNMGLSEISKYINTKSIFLILTLVFTLLIYSSNTIMFTYIDLLDNRTGQVLQLMEKRNALMKSIESLNPLSNSFFHSLRSDDLMQINIELRQSDIDFFNKEIEKALDVKSSLHKKGEFVSVHDNSFSSTSNTKIYHNNQQYSGKIKLHGKTKFHWYNPKKSYSVRLKKGDKIDGLSNFTFIVPDEQLLATLFSYDVSKRYGYMVVKSDLVRLKFNGINQGIYVLEEKISDDLLLRNNLDNTDVFKVIDEWSDQYLAQHITPFTNEESYAELRNYSKKDGDQFIKYRELIKNGNTYEDIKDLIDLDKFALHEAMRILFGDDHAVAGDNLTLFFDNETQKFYPHFRMEGYLERLRYSNYSKTFERELNTYFIWKVNLFSILNQNQAFRTKRNRYLQKISEDAEFLINLYSNYDDKYSDLITNDYTNNLPSRWYLNEIRKQKENLIYNLNEIKRYLNYARVYSSIEQTSNATYLLTITPDSNSKLTMENIFLNGISSQEVVNFSDHQSNKEYSLKVKEIPSVLKDIDFSLHLDNELEVNKNIFYYTIEIPDGAKINDYRISFKNDIDGTKVKKENVFTRNLIK